MFCDANYAQAMCLLVTILVYVLVLRDGQGMSTSFVREKLGEEAGINKWLRVCFMFEGSDDEPILTDW